MDFKRNLKKGTSGEDVLFCGSPSTVGVEQ